MGSGLWIKEAGRGAMIHGRMVRRVRGVREWETRRQAMRRVG